MIKKLPLIIFYLILSSFALYGQSQTQPISLLPSLEAIKKERVSVQNDFFNTQRKLVVKMDSKINLTDAEIAECLASIARIQNLRYSFGLDTSDNYCRISIKETSNRSQNQMGSAELKDELEYLFSYKLKKEPPLTKKDLDEAALCLRRMFNILRLEIYLNLSNDSNIMERLGYGRSRGGPVYR